jgi:hypothetical protein
MITLTDEQTKKIINAMSNAMMELRQMHKHYLPSCSQGCPTTAYIKELDVQIETLNGMMSEEPC